MAAGTVTMLGPYTIGDSSIPTDLTTEAGAIVKSVVPMLDAGNQKIYFLVVTEA